MLIVKGMIHVVSLEADKKSANNALKRSVLDWQKIIKNTGVLDADSYIITYKG